MTDYQLERFVQAQEAGGTYDQALRELRRSRKTSHWMWFVFPQLAGLGRSATAQHFGLASLEEARAYLAHAVLGPRLRECCEALLQADGDDAAAVLGSIDALKLRSSVTLFSLADEEEPLFTAVLDRFHAGAPDPLTLELLGR